MNIRAYNKHIVVKRDPDRKEETTKGGIIIQHEQKRREENQVVMRWGVVEHVGDEVETVKIGYRVGYNPFDAVEHYNIDTDTMYDVVQAVGIRCYIKA